MLERIEQVARFSVARGCGFAAIGVLTFFVGLSADLALALKSAGVLGLIVCSVLLSKAQRARTQPYQRTEVWILLKPQERPRAEIAQQLIGAVLRETYLSFAFHAAIFSALSLASSLAFHLLRVA